VARNAGIARSCAPWVTFLDSDDAYAPGHLAARMRLARPGVDAIFGGARLVGPRTLHWCADVDRSGKKIHISRCHIGGTLFVRRTVLEALGGFDPTFGFGEDHELMRRIEGRYRVKHCTARTYVYDLSRRDRLGALFLRGGEAAITEHRKPPTRRA
jgi:hypothetical protein